MDRLADHQGAGQRIEQGQRVQVPAREADRAKDEVAEGADRVKDGAGDVADKVSDAAEDMIPGDSDRDGH